MRYKIIIQVKLLVLFVVLTVQVSAQKRIFIPDINLRNELSKQGFMTNDSLDIQKIQGRLILELDGKGIENLEGLQYFEKVWRLVIHNNKIKRLAYLPPNLTDLFCSHNQISLIDYVPINLERLECSHNQISSIKNLPSHLVSIDFSNNSMKNMPLLPKTIQYINYSHNPIPKSSLPKIFQRLSCDDQSQNCLPYELMDWKTLNITPKDTIFEITGMTVKLKSGYAWGFGSQVETINYNLNKSKLVADKMEIKRNYGDNIQQGKKDSTYYNKVEYSVKISSINQLLKDIYSNQLRVKIQVNDSINTINLKSKKNVRAYFGDNCSDCSEYYLQYIIYSQTDTIKLNYRFDSDFGENVPICFKNGTADIKATLDWLYIYKLTNLTLNKHEATTYFFNENNLSKIIQSTK